MGSLNRKMARVRQAKFMKVSDKVLDSMLFFKKAFEEQGAPFEQWELDYLFDPSITPQVRAERLGHLTEGIRKAFKG